MVEMCGVTLAPVLCVITTLLPCVGPSLHFLVRGPIFPLPVDPGLSFTPCDAAWLSLKDGLCSRDISGVDTFSLLLI